MTTAATAGDQAELIPTPSARTTGLWSVPDDAYPDDAGTYAVVIGVSAYKHFAGGDEPASETYNLKQLFSSAYSAHQFFDWLRTSFRITGSPVRKVWLLLSPTADEAKLLPNEDYAPANFANIADAIRDWYNALSGISRQAAQNSRCLFFFSGHGVEINTDKQVLLPADYLAKSPPMLTEAISTYNLYLGMGRLGIPVQCFLVDACRSDAEDLRQQSGFDGAKILLEPFGGQNPKRNAPIVYAAATGTSTYQSRIPQEMSFFADGLLAGLQLRGWPEIPALIPEALPSGRSGIKLSPLCEFVNAAMNRSLKNAGYPPDDPITIGGTQKATPIVVSEIQPPKGKAGGPGAPAPPASLVSMGTSLASSGGAPPTLGKAAIFERLRPVPGGDNYGHESATAFFGLGELNEYDGQHWLRTPHRFTNHITRIEGEGADYRRICFTTPDPSRWFWLRCENEWSEYGFLFPPTDRESQLVEFAIESVVSRDRIDARAVLSPHNAALLPNKTSYVAIADKLWRSYDGVAKATAFDDVFAAADVAPGNVDAAINVLYNKWDSPLAATIGSMILLRGGGDEETAQWQENLGLRVAYTSDGAIFVLQRMMQTDRFDTAVAHQSIAQVEELGLPFTAEAFAYISNLLGPLGQLVPFAEATPTFERIAEFNAFTRPGSLFLAVAASAASRAKGNLRDRLLGMAAMTA